MSEYKNPIEFLIHSTVRIECDTEEGTSYGSGYFYAFLQEEGSRVECVVTNKHVLEDGVAARIRLTIEEDSQPQIGRYVTIQLDRINDLKIDHPDPDIDLAVIPIGKLINDAFAEGYIFHRALLTKEITATPELLETLPTVEDIIMIGYPNGIWDSKHNLPIVRKGITATHPKLPLNGKSEFLIDAACFPGSSGSPVFLANVGYVVNDKGELCSGNRILLLGTLYAGPIISVTGDIKVVNIPTDEAKVSISEIPINLGYVIQASKLNDFESILADKLRGYEP